MKNFYIIYLILHFFSLLQAMEQADSAGNIFTLKMEETEPTGSIFALKNDNNFRVQYDFFQRDKGVVKRSFLEPNRTVEFLIYKQSQWSLVIGNTKYLLEGDNTYSIKSTKLFNNDYIELFKLPISPERLQKLPGIAFHNKTSRPLKSLIYFTTKRTKAHWLKINSLQSKEFYFLPKSSHPRLLPSDIRMMLDKKEFSLALGGEYSLEEREDKSLYVCQGLLTSPE